MNCHHPQYTHCCLIDIEGEAERETHNRMIDEEDEKTANYSNKLKPKFMRETGRDSLYSARS